MNKVYIVDEEYHFAANVASALRFDGKEATVFHDATDALLYFSSNSRSIDPLSTRFLIDVSLAPGDDLKIFNKTNTDEFFQTGIVLVERLLERCNGLFLKENTILYTAHYATSLWDRIERFCNIHHFRYWQKVPNVDVDEFIKNID